MPSTGRAALSGTASFSPAPSIHANDETHPVLHAGRVAVVTGAASGLGAAAARAFAELGMKVALADVPARESALVELGAELEGAVGKGNVLVVPTDVTDVKQVQNLRDKVYEAWSEVAVLLNNAGIMRYGPQALRGTSWENLDAWHAIFNVNLFGVVNVQQTFVPSMLHQENPSMVINTGSKQGITNPPGNAAYNASKAAVKSLTEGLAHELRNTQPSVTAHLFVPGWVYTGLTGARPGVEKPAGAWSAEETVKYLLAAVSKGDFYVICPDNDTPAQTDQLRIMWGAADVAQGRPPLSRWHRDYKALFEEYMREGSAAAADGTPAAGASL